MKEKRISFSAYMAEHIYELILENFIEGCPECIEIKAHFRSFLGEKTVRRIKRIVKKHPYGK